MKETMNSYVFGSAMETAACADTPTFASCAWNAFTSVVSFAYETSSAGDPGTITAVEDEVGEKASASVVGAILSILVLDKEISMVHGQCQYNDGAIDDVLLPRWFSIQSDKEIYPSMMHT